jgi:CMP-N-acetylneuraminic acid synthetase
MITVFIPAKGNSVSVQSKNLQKVGNFSLVRRALNSTYESDMVDNIVLSTDSEAVVHELGDFLQIGNLTKGFLELKEGFVLRVLSQGNKNFILHRRRSEHATPDSRTIHSVIDYLGIEEILGLSTSSVFLLQPTSPFRLERELDVFINYFLLEPQIPLASIKRVESPHPQKVFLYSGQNQVNFSEEEISRMTSPRQSLAEYAAFDGAFYGSSVSKLHEANSFVGPETRTFLRHGHCTINIDSHEDLSYARFVSTIEPW